MRTLATLALLVGTASADVVVTGSELIQCKVIGLDGENVSAEVQGIGTRLIPCTDIERVCVDDVHRADAVASILRGTGIRISVTKVTGDTPRPDPEVQAAQQWLPPPPEVRPLRELTLYDAGIDLRGARDMTYWAVGLQVLSGIYSALVWSDTTVSLTAKVAVPLIVDLAAFGCYLAAWHRIGQAGDALRWAHSADQPTGKP